MDSPGRRPFILIADDNQDLAKGLSILLKLSGFDVETVHDGTAALKAALAHRPDVLLLDIGLPGMDGFQVAEHIRSDPFIKDILIIAISGYNKDIFQGRSQRAGFDHHLVKPADPQALLSLIGQLR
jgi:two-component system, chemotaxis family, CheB/CheR fusion protein